MQATIEAHLMLHRSFDPEKTFHEDRSLSTAPVELLKGRLARASAPASRPTRLQHFFEASCDAAPLAVAVECEARRLTYHELDGRSNRLAHFLIHVGCGEGARVGILLPRSVETYVALLAVLKAGATFVPIDSTFPPDRVAFIAADAELTLLITTSDLLEATQRLSCAIVDLEATESTVERYPRERPQLPGGDLDPACYVIYTSGSSGRPKGVEVAHSSICNLISIVPSLYGVEPTDRVYQGMTIAFDFSIEEIWPTWAVGATVVAGPSDIRLLGAELAEFLIDSRISVLWCVPTLLATLDREVPVRLLIVGGEACPAELVQRWSRPDRRMLNTYGPTETTVDATWGALEPGRPVTIGRALPTYDVYLLDEALQPVVNGQKGEICVAGPGVARGYLGRPELNATRFLANPFGAGGRLYRTGDFGRMLPDGEIEYLGRADSEVKVRGHRVDLQEIENVLLEDDAVGDAVVVLASGPGGGEVAAYLTLRSEDTDADTLRCRLARGLRDRLPAYMIPAFLEIVAELPTLASGKVDRAGLPAPASRLVVSDRPHAAATTTLESEITALLAGVVGLPADRVSIDSHFFEDLSANSLLMAHFCGQLRRREDLPSVSMKDVYLHPTVRRLAAAHEDAPPAPVVAPALAPGDAMARASTSQYVLCGALQLLIFLGYTYLSVLVMVSGFEWMVSAGAGFIDTYVRALIFGSVTFLYLCSAPIVAKWLLVGRWECHEIPLWSLAYVRFWTVKTLIRSNPLVLFVGSPLYVLYLRALGARIGRGVVIFSGNVPVCTDLLTIGDGTVIRKDSFFTGYQADAGVIRTGRVTVGNDVYVGEKTVIDIEASLGDGAQLGHCSCLHASVAVPEGQRWHGSPAQPTDVDYRVVEATHCGTLRRVAYSVMLLLSVLAYGPLGIAIAATLLTELPLLLETRERGPSAFTRLMFYGEILIISLVLFFGSVIAGLGFVLTVPRILHLALRADTVYPLYGFHYWAQRRIARMTNSDFHMEIFGDSSYIVGYLRALGYHLPDVEQTGSNFGADQSHETPYLVSVGRGTMVADGLSVINADFSSTSFRVSRASIGSRSFFGNYVAYPSGAKVGDNCLLATKVMVPLDGPVREGVGLLGSPCFEIPRSVERDRRFDHLKDGEEFRRRLAAKNKHNIVTIGCFLFARWIHFYVTALVALAGLALYDRVGALAIAAVFVVITVFSVAYFVFVERAATGFQALAPKFCSIYDPYFWWHERTWKLHSNIPLHGTPFKNLIWRLLGVRIGRRVFDDGAAIVEKTLVTIGDDCTFNAGTVLQGHSLEDGTFKSDHITIGAGCTFGIGTLVHYGVTVGDGAVVDADSFLMKGEEIVPRTRWRGNPATEIA
jgi:non-ribosomal peptide synthetase-like protein